jgi:hypothetical protein
MKLKKEKKTKIDQVEDYKSKIWRFEIQPESTILVESGATDKGIAIKAHYLSTHGARELDPSIDIVENTIWYCIQTL